MLSRRRIVIMILALILTSIALHGQNISYVSGILADVNRYKLPFPLAPKLRVMDDYIFVIEVGDDLYLGACDDLKYVPAEWKIGDKVEFKIKNKTLFLRRKKQADLALEYLGKTNKPQ